jgi:hypothetical protein
MQRLLGSLLAALAMAGAIMMATAVSSAQAPSSAVHTGASASNRTALELSVGYESTFGDLITGSHFWMQGGNAQVHGRFYRGWGAVADIAGAHIGNINSTGIGLDLVTATFGPRYTWSPVHARYSVFAQGLVGEAFGVNGVFPGRGNASTTANGIAVKPGGGVDFTLGPHVALRIFEADYLRTQFPNSTNNAQNNLHLGAGIILRFR